jgi:hypothetical protein
MAGRPDANKMLAVAMYGTARKLAVDAGSMAEAQRVRADLAAGRHDLLAQEAGLMAGYWSAAVQRTNPVELLASGLLIVAGPVDVSIVARWAEIGRRRAAAPICRAQ